jgi:PAS domain S-box-containing protein
VNRWFCELTGYTAEELARLSAYDLTDPGDVERDRAGWEETVRELTPSFAIEKRYRRKDGATIWVHVTSTLVRNALGEPLHAIGVIRDITDRRHAMEELHKTRTELESRVLSRTAELAAATAAARESARRLELLIDSSPLAMMSLDKEGLVHLWNPAAERLFGWSAREVLGQPMPHLPSKNRAHYAEEIRMVLTSPEQRSWETKRQRRDGSIVDVEVWRVALSSPDPGGQASIAIVLDITERKFLERALLEASERESRRIGQELHDNLCQHLLGAAFSAKAVAMSQPEDLPVSVELHELARLINSAVQQTRDIARGLNPVEMDAAGLMAALQALADRPYAEIACRLECDRNVLLLDAGVALHAYRIAQEAVANAVRHAGATEIVIRLAEDGGNIVLQIADNGRGFEFQPTQRQGLGLEIMKYRAHAISGKIRVNTAPGRGTNVVLVLPK